MILSSKISLALCLAYYNDRKCLKRMLKSLFPIPVEYRDNIALIAIDGLCKGFDNNDNNDNNNNNIKSTDGSYELIEWFKKQKNTIKVINTVTPTVMSERDKRQMYVDIAAKQKIDFLLIVDCDEYFHVINWKKLFEELETIKNSHKKGGVFSIFSTNVDTSGTKQKYSATGYWPRLWYRPEQMHYTTAHNRFKRRDSDDIRTGDSIRELSDEIIEMHHNPTDCRPAERLEKRRHYKSILGVLESHS